MKMARHGNFEVTIRDTDTGAALPEYPDLQNQSVGRVSNYVQATADKLYQIKLKILKGHVLSLDHDVSFYIIIDGFRRTGCIAKKVRLSLDGKPRRWSCIMKGVKVGKGSGGHEIVRAFRFGSLAVDEQGEYDQNIGVIRIEVWKSTVVGSSVGDVPPPIDDAPSSAVQRPAGNQNFGPVGRLNNAPPASGAASTGSGSSNGGSRLGRKKRGIESFGTASTTTMFTPSTSTIDSTQALIDLSTTFDAVVEAVVSGITTFMTQQIGARPLVTFEFKYRSEAVLKQMGVIPANDEKVAEQDGDGEGEEAAKDAAIEPEDGGARKKRVMNDRSTLDLWIDSVVNDGTDPSSAVEKSSEEELKDSVLGKRKANRGPVSKPPSSTSEDDLQDRGDGKEEEWDMCNEDDAAKQEEPKA